MSYGKGICVGCNRRVVTKDGCAIPHDYPNTKYECDGSDEPIEGAEASAAVPAPVKAPAPIVVEPKPPPVELPSDTLRARTPRLTKPTPSPKPTPIIDAHAKPVQTEDAPKPDDNALRLLALRLNLNKGASLSDAVSVVNTQGRTGSIDLEALAECECPSLAAAIKGYLGRPNG